MTGFGQKRMNENASNYHYLTPICQRTQCPTRAQDPPRAQDPIAGVPHVSGFENLCACALEAWAIYPTDRLSADLRTFAGAPGELADGFIRGFPRELVFQPDLSRRGEEIRTVQGARCHINGTGLPVTFVRERAAAETAELARNSL